MAKSSDTTIIILLLGCCFCLFLSSVGAYFFNLTCDLLGFGASCPSSPAPGPSGTPSGTPSGVPGPSPYSGPSYSPTPSGTPSGVPGPSPYSGPSTCPAGKYLSGNSCVMCPTGTYKKTTSTLQSDCLSVPNNAWPNSDQSDWGCQPNYSKNSAGTGCQLNDYKVSSTYYPGSYYDSSAGQNMTVSAAKARMASTQGDSDPVIGFSCDVTGYNPNTGCTDSSSGQCWFIRNSKLPLPYPNWPNSYGCTWIRSDVTVIPP